jgi:two-component system response regulator PhoP
LRLLVVEDDRHLREQLCQHFVTLNWQVVAAQSGCEARYLMGEFDHDIGIIDLGLPDMSGISLIQAWRDSGVDIPLLILTARGDWQDKVKGLEAGADDYVTKPFHLEELSARLQALLRRSRGRSTNVAHFPPLRINFSAQTVHHGDREILLTAFEFRLLATLAHHAGEVLPRHVLMGHLYDDEQDRDPNVLEVLLGRLRRKLDPDNMQRYIDTIRGVGYRFVVEEALSDRGYD